MAAVLLQPFKAAGRAYNAAAQRRPFLVGTITTITKTSAADLFAQTVGGALCCFLLRAVWCVLALFHA